uniref:Uncharacterized protein n=1 Tax=Arion vulgaris TaxID=1028688 RepID=A0A0B7B567_9EUPU
MMIMIEDTTVQEAAVPGTDLHHVAHILEGTGPAHPVPTRAEQGVAHRGDTGVFECQGSIFMSWSESRSKTRSPEKSDEPEELPNE